MSGKSVFSNVYVLGSSAFQINLTAFHSLIRRFQVVLIVLVTVFAAVHRRVSMHHSHNIGVIKASDRGIDHNLLYRFSLLQALFTAFLTVLHVFHIHFQVSSIEYKAVCV